MSELDGTLFGYGRMTWSDAQELLEGFRAAWSDLDGWHVDNGALPDRVPVATHVWAWDTGSDRWARLRIDHDSVIVGVLVGPGGTHPATDGLEAEAVTYTVSRGVPWHEDQQIPPRGEAIRHLRFEVAEVQGVKAIDFVRLSDT